MELFGYSAAIIIGVTLGLIGGGGSILTVPVLVYLFHIQPESASSYSLFIVGLTSVVGAIKYVRNKNVDFNAVIYFGTASIIAVWFTRHYLLPNIPSEIVQIGHWTLTKQFALMMLFAVLMILAAYKMIKPSKQITNETKVSKSTILLQGFIVGIVTGLLGAGGGFLIIPALMGVLKLDIKKAIGSSLIIIAVNSLIGFSASLSTIEVDWMFLFYMTGLAIIGILIGTLLSSKISNKKLKPAFGWFVLAMGIYIIIKETILK